MLKKIGIPVLALVAILTFAVPTHANGAVRFGVSVGPAYTYPYPYVYSYPYGYGYDPYYYPYVYNYAYPYGVYGGRFYWGGHHDRGHREFHEHAFRGHEGHREGHRR